MLTIVVIVESLNCSEMIQTNASCLCIVCVFLQNIYSLEERKRNRINDIF